MSINEILMVELEGLSSTIQQYSNDNYIISYAKQLMNIKYPEESLKLTLLVKRIYAWYSNEIDKIKTGEFVISKEAHIHSFEVICRLYSLINK
jgi:hypothetical protein